MRGSRANRSWSALALLGAGVLVAAALVALARPYSGQSEPSIKVTELRLGEMAEGKVAHCDYALFKIWLDANPAAEQFSPFGSRGEQWLFNPFYTYKFNRTFDEAHASSIYFAGPRDTPFESGGQIDEARMASWSKISVEAGSGWYEFLVLSVRNGYADDLSSGCQPSRDPDEAPAGYRFSFDTIGLGIQHNAHCTISGTRKDDVLTGTPRRDVICGYGGNDRIIARGGNDLIEAGLGNDTVRAGPGDDVILAVDGKHDVLDGESGRDHVWGDRGKDRLIHVESRAG